MIQKCRVPISYLHCQAFCEQEIYLREVLGLEDLGADYLDKGQQVHKGLEDDYEVSAQIGKEQRLLQGKPIPESLSEAVVLAKQEGITFCVRELFVQGKRIEGRLDCIEITPDCIRIIDDKPRAPTGKPYFSEIRQVGGYCLALREQYPDIDLPIYAIIRDENTGAKLWEKKFDAAYAADVDDAIDRIVGIIEGTRKAQPTQYPFKCKKCRWHCLCPESKYKEDC